VERTQLSAGWCLKSPRSPPDSRQTAPDDTVSPLIDVDRLLAAPPVVHGEPMCLEPRAARFLAARLRPGQRTLETGCGLSTAIFAAAGTQHTVVVIELDEEVKLRRYAESMNIDMSQVTFIIGPSQEVLPALRPHDLDVVLIDGRHGFPAPYIDWYYAGSGLKVGGLMVVDDTQIWTGFELKRFMAAEPAWTLVADFPPRTTAYERVSNLSLDAEWAIQPHIRRMSRLSDMVGMLDMVRHDDPRTTLSKLNRRVHRIVRGS
jgi:hypothetical protein